MKSKKLLCAAVAVAITMGASLTAGCVATNNEVDVKQVVATVDITKDENFTKEFAEYATAITEETFLKRDMLYAFMGGYYQYVQSQNYSYADTFEIIKRDLTQNAIVTQYATASLVRYKDKDTTVDFSLEQYKTKTTDVEKYEYLLGGADSEGVRRAKYNVNSSLNSTIDSYEKKELKDQKDDEYAGTDTRTAPGKVDTLKDDYVPKKYNVYTGYENYLLADAGDEYEPLNKTNRNTRRKAYSEYIGFLDDNYMLSANESDTTDIWKLTYVQESYVSELQSQIVSEFNEYFEKEQEDKINTVDDSGVYTYVKNSYDGLDGAYTSQCNQYQSASTFESAMDGLSDTSFLMYSPSTENDTDKDDNNTYGMFGYVYNILLPFDTMQSVELTKLQSYKSSKEITESEYFYERNQILKSVVTTDQRAAWFNGEKNYSFNAKEYNEGVEDGAKLNYYAGTTEGYTRDYLFFENNLTKTDKYDALEKYAGMYTYNGKVIENDDGSYRLLPEKLDINGMLSEFKAYVNYVLGYDGVAYTETANYYGTESFIKDGTENEIDYSKLVYASGKVTFNNDRDTAQKSKCDMFDKNSDRYKAMSAVNELQYAYTTDTGVLSQYIGYSVSAYDTSYIKEFEYAAQQAIREGVGSFKVCAGDYGWHLIYVTDRFEWQGGAAYSPDWTENRITTEGTFEYRFYQVLKDAALKNETSYKRAEIIKAYDSEKSVTVYKDAYKDLSELV